MLRLLLTVAVAAAVAAAAFAAPASAANVGCPWLGPTAYGIPNVALPDRAAAYWLTSLRPTATTQITLHGEFPHTRYMSLNAYDAAGRPTDSLPDVRIGPDRGATNPFVEGADRGAKARGYTIAVVALDAPSDPALRAANTLYLGAGASTSGATVIYRTYVPDTGRDLNGDVPLPSPRVALAGRAVALRGIAGCRAATAGASLGGLFAGSSMTEEDYLALRDQPGASPTHPAVNPPAWEAFFNLDYALGVFAVGTPEEIAAQRAAISPSQDGGVYSNRDTRYIFTHADRQFGELLVLRGHAPVTPNTHGGDRVMGAGQVRYWSICQNESFFTQRVVACAYDEQIPRDSDGDYIVVIGRALDRPTNATRACGVAWLPWGPQGDGAGRTTAGLLLLRQILGDPAYPQAIVNVRTPGAEQEVMGDDLPMSEYTSTADFERRGCPSR